MKHLIVFTLFIMMICLGFALEANTAGNAFSDIGVVDFRLCIEHSKLGKQGQDTFDELKQQTISSLEVTEKEINALADNLNDGDYIDSLSPETQKGLEMEFNALNEKFSRDQNQYYQMLNQANYKLIQTTQESVNRAAKKVAAERSFKVVVNEDSCFFFSSDLDITSLVIAEMDKDFAEINASFEEETVEESYIEDVNVEDIDDNSAEDLDSIIEEALKINDQ
ncbi:MAG: OmpH family outer membrane protein [Waddliaceae bacterium]|jgi:outer membrane protein|nr:OmpH family outer membrane protein [Waddliaceae bacterium]MBT3579251.1 OmpH family outer membrane protein [Waddliaceae bacterium]MBT4444767.1 OmpH family outer membrane protein [Waddliaceae bacterium]MBT6929151.1 OmpH family outer membrane protein [Waddliaceae bacterium]MBT7264706.1 OmpH family outer membrane protein [Waddliaceae bacterium]